LKLIFKSIFISFLFNFIISFTYEIEFVSANPFSMKDIITNIDNLKEQSVSGILTLPEGKSNQKFPLIIAAAGSKDWSSHHIEYLKMYNEMGIATLELQSFKSRGETSTVGSQNTVTIPMIILDSYRAIDKLADHPNIDINRVALTGWSLGGGVTLFSAWKPIIDAINPQNSFAAHLALYPPCFAEPETLQFSDSPIHILIGELDQWVPAQACVELTDKLNKVGHNIGLTVYKDAHHSFDRNQDLIIAENAYNFTDCRFNLTDDGAVRMKFLNIPMTTPFMQKIGFSMCASRNPLFGGHKESRDLAFDFSKEFMYEHLLKE